MNKRSSMKRLVRYSRKWKVLKGLYSPGWLFSQIVKRIPFAPFWLKCALDGFNRPSHAYGVVQAALQAKALGINEISVIEFGVGKGGGLLELESYGNKVAKNLHVKVNIFGFDLGTGLPSPVDYRDCPYIWQKGFYKMDIEELRSKLTITELIIGDVKSTISTFLESYNVPPIGFISFDLDFYSSTEAAFRILETDKLKLFLPRTFCHFDDIIGPDEALHSEYTGELLAIAEFNKKYKDRKIAKIHGLRDKRIAPCYWSEQMFVFHLFEHPNYSTFVNYKL